MRVLVHQELKVLVMHKMPATNDLEERRAEMNYTTAAGRLLDLVSPK